MPLCGAKQLCQLKRLKIRAAVQTSEQGSGHQCLRKYLPHPAQMLRCSPVTCSLFLAQKRGGLCLEVVVAAVEVVT